MSEQKWQETLSEEEYRVCRNAGTERPFTGALLDEAREGTYVCKCCGADLFSSQTKFDAGCGWPSFFQPIEDFMHHEFLVSLITGLVNFKDYHLVIDQKTVKDIINCQFSFKEMSDILIESLFKSTTPARIVANFFEIFTFASSSCWAKAPRTFLD